MDERLVRHSNALPWLVFGLVLGLLAVMTWVEERDVAATAKRLGEACATQTGAAAAECGLVRLALLDSEVALRYLWWGLALLASLAGSYGLKLFAGSGTLGGVTGR